MREGYQAHGVLSGSEPQTSAAMVLPARGQASWPQGWGNEAGTFRRGSYCGEGLQQEGGTGPQTGKKGNVGRKEMTAWG